MKILIAISAITATGTTTFSPHAGGGPLHRRGARGAGPCRNARQLLEGRRPLRGRHLRPSNRRSSAFRSTRTTDRLVQARGGNTQNGFRKPSSWRAGPTPRFRRGDPARLKAVDYVVRGEGELALAELLERGAKRAPAAGAHHRESGLKDLDRAPRAGPLWRRHARHRPERTVQIPHHQPGLSAPLRLLLFAAVWGRETAFGAPGRIVDEIEHCVKTHGILYFSYATTTSRFAGARARILPPSPRAEALYNVELPVARRHPRRGDGRRDEARRLEHIFSSAWSRARSSISRDVRQTDDRRRHREGVGGPLRRAGAYLSFYLMAGMENERSATLK